MCCVWYRSSVSLPLPGSVSSYRFAGSFLLDSSLLYCIYCLPQVLSSIFKFLNNFYWSVLLDTVLLVPTIKQSESALCIYIYSLSFRFSSYLGHRRALSRIPCAIRQIRISYLFHTWYQKCVQAQVAQW